MAPKSDTESATPTVCIDCPRDHVRYAGPLLGCVTKYQARPRKKRDEEARTSVSGGKGRKRKWEAELAVLAAATVAVNRLLRLPCLKHHRCVWTLFL